MAMLMIIVDFVSLLIGPESGRLQRKPTNKCNKACCIDDIQLLYESGGFKINGIRFYKKIIEIDDVIKWFFDIIVVFNEKLGELL
ncbi:hypothetical protein QYG89_12855 [Bacillus sp. B190/17]|uniref:Uncharacterized protein n=1 Tax=Bacillus lumedeiriae TaxID=3058829 RepID=A0ABW8IAN3_9BACI